MRLARCLLGVGLLCGFTVMAGGDKTRGGAAWSPLFAGEAWYQRESAPEEEFAGVLESRRDGDGPSALQRGAYYRLGERNVYTGATRPAALEARVGTEVVIRGKAIDMRLEGAAIREIWPAAVRSVR